MPPVTPLSLADWAALPLHRVAASAAVCGAGALSSVGGIEAKAAAASRTSGLRALGVSANQCWGSHNTTHPAGKPLGERTAGGLSILKATRVDALAQSIAGRLGDAVYGPVVPLPQVLTLADANKRFDYRAETFHPFEWLDALVADALHALPSIAAPGLQAQDPPLGELRKHLPKGYLHVLGTAGSGKTSWALNWARQGPGPVGTLPRLAGWYFARRFGASGVGQDNEQDEIAALQNLVSLARRQRDVLPANPLLLSAEEARAYRRQPHPQRSADNEEERTLRERFIEALNELVAAPSPQGPPSAESPLVFLIDGGDEMWGASARHARWTFPRILPTLDQLPDHVYIVLLSRPGAHMLDFRSREPLLRYQFERQHVNAAIGGYLTQQAHKLQALYPGNDASELLLNTTLQGHIARASGGAFGYAPLLMWQWHADRALEGHIDLQAERLRDWLRHPGSLPDGVYGLRAREFLDMQEKLENQGSKGMTLARALALLTQLRWPLTQRELTELLYPADAAVPAHLRDDGDALDRLETLLQHGAGWLSGVQQRDAALQFGHQSLAEVAQAAWRLSCQGWPLTEPALVAEARALAAANAGEAPPQSTANLEAQSTQDTELSAALRQQADAWLHADLAGRIDQEAHPPRWPAQQALQPPTPWLRKGQPAPTAWAYNLVWGPLHALTAAAGLPPIQQAEPYRQLAQRARQLLINAPYLQTAIRAQAKHVERQALQADPQALRQTYIMADKLEGDDPEQPLRHRVESALLEWHPHIASGAAQVGGVLWNLLGADPSGQAYAEAWKASLDQPALITERPGSSSAFARMIPAKQSALTECGNWLVTSDADTYTEVWDLRDGWHRAVVHRRVDWPVPSHLCVCSDGSGIAIGGSADNLLLLGWIDLWGDGSHLARYAGHRNEVRSIALHAVTTAQGQVTHWALASGSSDRTVGLLVRSPEDVLGDAARSSANPESPNPGVMARYAGHRNEVCSIALHAVTTAQGQVTHCALASGSDDETVGLLVRSPQDVPGDAERSSANPESPNPGVMARYAGHRYSVRSIALHAVTAAQGQVTHWALASGSDDSTVGLLVRSPEDLLGDAARSLANPETPNPGVLARYAGHRRVVRAIALHAVTTAQGQVTHLALASGSHETVGLLVRSIEDVLGDAARSSANPESPNPGVMARYAGHRNSVESIALHAVTTAQGQVTHFALASGSDDTVGLLVRSPQDVPEDAARSLANPETPNPGVLARYAGHRRWVRSIALHAVTTAKGQVTHWALASGSDDTVGLLVRSPEDLLGDAARSLANPETPNPGVLARYAGHLHWVYCIALHAVTTAQGQVTHWALASGSNDRTVGLLVRSPEDVLGDAARSSANPESPNPGVMARYAGHLHWVHCIALHAVTTAQGQVTHLALASGSDDNTVGLLVRSPEDLLGDAARSLANPMSPNPGVLALYAGHRSLVRSIALHAVTTAKGQVTHLALASGSMDNTVGLLVRSPQDVPRDAARSWANPETPNPGVLARYAGHLHWVRSIALHAVTTAKGQVTHWALASGSFDRTVGLLVRSPEDVPRDAARSSANPESPNPGVMARYAGHRYSVRSIALHAVTTAKGQVTHWALASGSPDRTVGHLTVPHESLQAHCAAAQPTEHLLKRLHTGRPGAVDLRGALAPASSGGEPSGQADAPLHWLGGDSGVAFIWQSTPQTGLQVQFACPYYAEGFKAMAFAQAPDRVHYMVGGAVDHTVAMLPLRLFDPSSPDTGLPLASQKPQRHS